MSIYTPYTYLIGWSKLNKFYYGSRTAKKSKCLYESGCHPDELMKKYFTSSEEVHKLIQEYGLPDIVQIRKTFPNNPDAAFRWEGKVLHRLQTGCKEKWLNQGYLTNVPNSWTNKTEEERKIHANNIQKALKKNGTHNWSKKNRKGLIGNEFTSETAKETANRRMKNGKNLFTKLCCIDREGNVVWLPREDFYKLKPTGDFVMNSSNEGKRRLKNGTRTMVRR